MMLQTENRGVDWVCVIEEMDFLTMFGLGWVVIRTFEVSFVNEFLVEWWVGSLFDRVMECKLVFEQVLREN